MPVCYPTEIWIELNIYSLNNLSPPPSNLLSGFKMFKLHFVVLVLMMQTRIQAHQQSHKLKAEKIEAWMQSCCRFIVHSTRSMECRNIDWETLLSWKAVAAAKTVIQKRTYQTSLILSFTLLASCTRTPAATSLWALVILPPISFENQALTVDLSSSCLIWFKNLYFVNVKKTGTKKCLKRNEQSNPTKGKSPHFILTWFFFRIHIWQTQREGGREREVAPHTHTHRNCTVSLVVYIFLHFSCV